MRQYVGWFDNKEVARSVHARVMTLLAEGNPLAPHESLTFSAQSGARALVRVLLLNERPLPPAWAELGLTQIDASDYDDPTAGASAVEDETEEAGEDRPDFDWTDEAREQLKHLVAHIPDSRRRRAVYDYHARRSEDKMAARGGHSVTVDDLVEPPVRPEPPNATMPWEEAARAALWQRGGETAEEIAALVTGAERMARQMQRSRVLLIDVDGFLTILRARTAGSATVLVCSGCEKPIQGTPVHLILRRDGGVTSLYLHALCAAVTGRALMHESDRIRRLEGPGIPPPALQRASYVPGAVVVVDNDGETL